MNIYANGRGRTALEFETDADESEPEFDWQRIWRGIDKVVDQVVPVAQYLAPIASKVLVNGTPTTHANINPLTAQLLQPLLAKGDRYTRQKEAEFFGTYEAEIELAHTSIAEDAALMEVLAAEASHTDSESEAVALISTALPMTFRVMAAQQLLRPVLPLLLVATARLVRWLHRHSRQSRRLLRLVPTIFRRTIASLLVAQQWGCLMTSALVGCIIAAQTRRVLANASLVNRAMTRNILIRVTTVAAVPSFPGVRKNKRFF
ncbi:hypothetical protein [Nostoc sp. TCL26-01]|uniref:hypothetical protein n=1 Tax=Nostoc sp. TCL26-01 TaxID=2576904 RepID=UPI0015C07621|nr:hypothetical protein [Nostoc sp. TCL26-01]QLE55444.1 hypothetical protein FD725_07895 [Nostoc sp. TCL26-01]